MLGEVALMPQGVVLSRCENKLSVSQDDRWGAEKRVSVSGVWWPGCRFRLRAFGGWDVDVGCGCLVAGTQVLGVYW